MPAFAGALAGVAAAVPVAAALSYVPLQGRTFGLFQLMPSPAWLAGVVGRRGPGRGGPRRRFGAAAGPAGHRGPPRGRGRPRPEVVVVAARGRDRRSRVCLVPGVQARLRRRRRAADVRGARHGDVADRPRAHLAGGQAPRVPVPPWARRGPGAAGRPQAGRRPEGRVADGVGRGSRRLHRRVLRGIRRRRRPSGVGPRACARRPRHPAAGRRSRRHAGTRPRGLGGRIACGRRNGDAGGAGRWPSASSSRPRRRPSPPPPMCSTDGRATAGCGPPASDSTSSTGPAARK